MKLFNVCGNKLYISGNEPALLDMALKKA